MLRVVLLGLTLLLLVPSSSHALQLIDQSLTPPVAAPPVSTPTKTNRLRVDWLIGEAMPSLAIGALTLMVQSIYPLGEEGGDIMGLPGPAVLLYWGAFNVLASVLSTGIVYALARSSGTRPSFGVMLLSSFAIRMAGALTAFLATVFIHPNRTATRIVRSVPLGLGAIVATGAEVLLAQSDESEHAAKSVPETPVSRIGDTPPQINVSLFSMRF